MTKNFCRLALICCVMLVSCQMVWADGVYYYAKAKALVSSKSNGMGTVYVGPAVQFTSADEATSVDGTQSTSGSLPFNWDEEGVPSQTGTLEDLEHWFAPANTEAIVCRKLASITDAGTAKPVYAAYMAQANPGYYFKGWSTVNNDAALGNVNPFAYPVMSQAMTMSASVKEVQVYVPGSETLGVAGPQPMGMYVAEGKSNRYMVAVGPYCVEHNGPEWDEEKFEWSCSKEVFRCPKVDGQYELYDMDPSAGVMHLYIPHFDNVTRHVYVINDNGEKVEIKDVNGSYLTFPKDAEGNTIIGATYIVYKNPYYKVAGNPLRNYEFLPHRYNAASLANALNLENYPAENYLYELNLGELSTEEITAIVTQRIQEAVMTNVQNTLLTADYGSESALLLVNFQTVYALSGYENDQPIYAPAMAYSEGNNDNPIGFLPAKEELPIVPTMYATFAPVQINGCTGGNIVNWGDVTDNTFNVTFSTSYASSTADFGAVTFDKQPTGGTYSAVVTGYNDNEVTIAVTFTPSGSLADGEYKASMTLPSKGGESYVSCLVNVRVGEEANMAVAIGDNKYATLADALTAATAGDELTVLTNVAEGDVTIGKKVTLNLDGWTLTGNVAVNSTMTIKLGTIAGNVTVATSGNLTVDGTNVAGTLTNNGTANLKRGRFDGGTAISIYNSGTLTLEKGAEIMAQYNAGVVMASGSTGTVNGAKFYGPYPIDLSAGGNGVFNSGYFTQEFAEMAAMGLTHYNVTVGKTAEAGYTHFYAMDAAAAKAADVPVCKIGQTGYSTLEDALLYAQNNPSQLVTIIMTNDYTLPAGYYTLPVNASLLIPYQENQATIMGGNPKKLTMTEPYEPPFAFRTLTFANGVHMSVAGNIEASCMQFIAGKGETGNAIPSGAYGWLRLEKGAEVTMGNGSHLYAWGFVTGEGEIDVRRGGAVHEDFQVYDWPGGTAAMNMLLNSVATGAGAFPINQYFMQNVESQTTFHPGARMYASFGASAGGFQVAADAIQIVGIEGDVAMFLMNPNADADNTWVRKRYDVENDIQVWEVNSGAHLGSMNIEVPVLANFSGGAITGFDSRNFILPLTNNLKIRLLTGYMDITQNTELLPGAEIEIDKESTVEVLPATDASSGFLYLIDKADWDDAFACGRPGQQILYSPSWVERGHADGKPNVRNINSISDPDFATSKVNVHGTFRVSGLVLSTPSGTNIISTNEDAGTVLFPEEVNFSTALTGDQMEVHMPTAAIPNQLFDAMDIEGFPIPQCRTVMGSDGEYKAGVMQYMVARSALLHNDVGTPAESAGTTSNEIEFTDLGGGNYVPTLMIPGAWEPQEGDNFTMPGESFCYIRDRWTKMTQFDERFAYNNYNEWYIKPAEYVQVATKADPEGEFAGISTQPLENPDHTYSDANGEGRLFIWVDYPSDGGPGQWWEVTLEDNLYKGKNGTYYFFDDDDYMWVEKTFEISFLNWDGSPVLDHDGLATEYHLHYGDRIQYLGTNPTREENVDYTYTFTGWSPALTADTKVTGDATYTATFEAVQRKYTVIFLNENGTEIERHFLTRDEMPVCEAMPSKTGYYLQWTPAIGAVTGDAEYRATFTPEKPTAYTITFKNYNGTVLQSGDVNVGVTPACATPTKPATSEYTYAFDGWNPAIEPVSQEMTYTAKFREVAQTYAIRFFDENNVQIGATQNLAYGVAPAMPDYVKEADAEYTYTTTWAPQVAAVTKAQDYTAVITPTKNKYTVTINATGCVVNGAGAYDYGTEVTLSLGGALSGYENPVWSDGTTANKTITVTENMTFTATASIIASPTVLNIDLSAGGEDITLTEDTKVASINIVAGEGVATPQLFGAEYIDMMKGARAYFTYNFGTAEARQWYAFAVPFKCDAQTATAANGTTLHNTHEYDIVEYDGAIRAAQGKVDACWKNVSGTLVPGKLYMIVFSTNQTTITFAGKGNNTYYYDNAASVQAYPGHVAGDDYGYGWNGIANPALYSAMLKVQADRVRNAQVYTNGDYEVIDLDDPLAIAKPIFVQVPSTQSVAVDKASSSSSVAARRVRVADADRYVLNFGQDRVFLVNDDMAEDAYIAGQDLAKFGVSSKTAQVWVNRYGTKLCVNHQAAENGETTYPLGVFAPKAGSYTFNISDHVNNMQVLLLQNGAPVWNFRNGDCTRSLNAGTDNSYQICIKPVSGIATDVESVKSQKPRAEKVLIDGIFYILTDGATYDATGRLVK